MIKGAIFDVDGTLIDSMPMWIHFSSDTVASFGLEPEEGLDLKVRYFSLRETAEYISRTYPRIGTADQVEAVCMERTEDFYKNKVDLKRGVRPLLDRLSLLGVKMYIATATYRPLVEAALSRLGVLDMFEGAVTCAEVGFGKDRPDVFYAAADKLGAAPEDIWVFEDAMHAMITAKSSGFKVCGVYDDTEADHVNEIKELCDIYTDSFEQLDISKITQ